MLVWPQEGLWGPSGPELRRAAAHPEAEEPGHNASCVPLTGQLPAAGPGLQSRGLLDGCQRGVSREALLPAYELPAAFQAK